MKYLITFSYNGNYFKGYQKQKNLKTVQGVLEKKWYVITAFIHSC